MASSGTGSRMFNLFQINGNIEVFGHELELLPSRTNLCTRINSINKEKYLTRTSSKNKSTMKIFKNIIDKLIFNYFIFNETT